MGSSRLGKLLPRANTRTRGRSNSSTTQTVAATSEQNRTSDMGNRAAICQGTRGDTIPILLHRNGSRNTRRVPGSAWESTFQDLFKHLLLGPIASGLQPPTAASPPTMRMPSLRSGPVAQYTHSGQSEPPRNCGSTHRSMGPTNHETRRTVDTMRTRTPPYGNVE